MEIDAMPEPLRSVTAVAAALGGYLRELGKARVGDRLLIEQGVEMGPPSTITILVGAGTVLVTGTAAAIPTKPAGRSRATA